MALKSGIDGGRNSKGSGDLHEPEAFLVILPKSPIEMSVLLRSRIQGKSGWMENERPSLKIEGRVK
jgi:hypothetical protein